MSNCNWNHVLKQVVLGSWTLTGFFLICYMGTRKSSLWVRRWKSQHRSKQTNIYIYIYHNKVALVKTSEKLSRKHITQLLLDWTWCIYLKDYIGCDKTNCIFTNTRMTDDCSLFKSCGILICKRTIIFYSISILYYKYALNQFHVMDTSQTSWCTTVIIKRNSLMKAWFNMQCMYKDNKLDHSITKSNITNKLKSFVQPTMYINFWELIKLTYT